MTCKKKRSREQEPEPVTQEPEPMEETTNPLGTTALLPYDTIKDVLTRLPVQTLMRFETISKPFLSLIRSPEFVSAHLNRSSSRPMILVRRFHHPTGSQFTLSFVDPGEPVFKDIRVPFFGSLVRFPKIVASSAGVLCLDVSPCYALAFVLWNVATGRFRHLPQPLLLDAPGRQFWMVAAGFAYHPPSGEFLVVRVVYFKSDPDHLHEARAEVYASRTDSWKVFDRALTEPVLGLVSISEGQIGVLVNGSINWVANGVGKLGNRKFVVCYDMLKQEFRRVRGPDTRPNICVKVMEFKESLALALYPSLPVLRFDADAGIGLGQGIMENIELWAPEDVDGSHWTKLHSFSGQFPVVPGCPLGIWNDCELVVKRHEGQCVSLSVMDPRTQTFRRFPVCPPDFACDVYRYVESLML